MLLHSSAFMSHASNHTQTAIYVAGAEGAVAVSPSAQLCGEEICAIALAFDAQRANVLQLIAGVRCGELPPSLLHELPELLEDLERTSVALLSRLEIEALSCIDSGA